jgi:D-alanyl-lipoteichoic acid acyltransferase DltB (MBOAT superfamily)
MQAFWRRWHMSLTSWLTDYLFTPLSMTLRRLGQTGIVIAISVNMLIIGLWHGLTLNFLVFGLLQALFLNLTVVVLSYRARRDRGSRMNVNENALRQFANYSAGLLGAVTTFALMSFSMIFVHSTTWDQAIAILKQLLGFAPSGSLHWSDIGPDMVLSAYVCIGISLFVGAGSPGAKWLLARVDRVAPRWLQYGFCLFLLSVFFSDGSGQFIYGQF